MALSKRQLALRRSGIGASEIASLIGESKYSNPIAIYESKVVGVELEASYQMDLGSELEEPIARVWAKQHNKFLARVDTLQHRNKALALATPDRAVYSTAVARGDSRRLRTDVRDSEMLLQVKSTNWRLKHLWGPEGSDRIPVEYLSQAHWEGSVAGVDTVEFAVDFDKTKLSRYRVQVSPVVFEAMYEIAERFWVDHVLARKPPEPDTSERYGEFLQRAFPRPLRAELLQVAPDDPLSADISRFASLKAAEAYIGKALKLIHNRMRARTGEATGLEGAFGKVTFKLTRDGTRVDWEAICGELESVTRTLLMSPAVPEAQRTELLEEMSAIKSRHTAVRPGYRRLHSTWATPPVLQGGDKIELPALTAGEDEVDEEQTTQEGDSK